MEWQPIETAPKDETRILLTNIEWDDCVIGSWASWASEPCWDHSDENAGISYGSCNPTHWMPLPDPPQ